MPPRKNRIASSDKISSGLIRIWGLRAVPVTSRRTVRSERYLLARMIRPTGTGPTIAGMFIPSFSSRLVSTLRSPVVATTLRLSRSGKVTIPSANTESLGPASASRSTRIIPPRLRRARTSLCLNTVAAERPGPRNGTISFRTGNWRACDGPSVARTVPVRSSTDRMFRPPNSIIPVARPTPTVASESAALAIFPTSTFVNRPLPRNRVPSLASR